MTQYCIGLSDLNLGSKTETFLGGRVDKCKIQLGICRGTVFVLIIVKTNLGPKLVKLVFMCVKLFDYE